MGEAHGPAPAMRPAWRDGWMRGGGSDPDQLYEELRDAIVRLVHPPGAPIFETAMAAGAGVSRTPIRDALKRLRADGLVEIRPGHGTFVTRIDVDRLAEAVSLRALLEGEAAARAAGHAGQKAFVAGLQDIVAAQRRSLRAQLRDEVYRLDHAFHEAIFRGTGLPLMWASVRLARAGMDRIHHFAAADITRPQRAVAAHATIAGAIKAGDGEAARAAMTKHVQSNLGYLTELARSNPGFLMVGS